MKSITGLTLAVALVSLLCCNTGNAVPNCAKAGYNVNLPGVPYPPDLGWYSNCYIFNGMWIASPMRCGLVDPANVSAGYKIFDGTTCPAPTPPTTTAAPPTTTPSGRLSRRH